jgi:hypothetical protein
MQDNLAYILNKPEKIMSEEQVVAVEKKVNPNIINGRMPVAVVAQVRFGNNKGDATKALADLYGTTVGKIDDIKKNRNFAYVDATFKPTAAQKEEGVAWLQRHPKYSEGVVDAVITELETTAEASDEEATAFAAIRTAARGQPTTTKEGAVADAGGGNRREARKSKKVKATAEVDAGSTADALLA